MFTKTKISALLFVTLSTSAPSYAVDVPSWLKGLFSSPIEEPLYTPSGAGTGGGDPPGPKPAFSDSSVISTSGAGTGGGHPPGPKPAFSSSAIVTPAGPGTGGGHPPGPKPS